MALNTEELSSDVDELIGTVKEYFKAADDPLEAACMEVILLAHSAYNAPITMRMHEFSPKDPLAPFIIGILLWLEDRAGDDEKEAQD